MKKVLVLILMVATMVACSNKKENKFLSLMVAADWDNPSIIQNFTDDFKSFYDGRTEYNLKKVWHNGHYNEYIAQYSANDKLHYYVGSLFDPWGMDGTTYIYISPKIYGKYDLEMVTNILFQQDSVGYILDYISPSDGAEGY